MNNVLKVFRWFAILALMGIIFHGSLALMKETTAFANSGPGAGDFVTGWEQRMERVKNKLPYDVTLIGYVADWDLPGVELNLIDQDNEYMLSQYSLTPIKIVPGLEAEWILGNFTNPGFQIWLDQSLQDFKINELGFGIYLIHRETP